MNPKTGQPATLADGLAGNAVNTRGQKVDPDKIRASFNKMATQDKEVGFTNQSFGTIVQDLIKQALRDRVLGAGGRPNAGR